MNTNIYGFNDDYTLLLFVSKRGKSAILLSTLRSAPEILVHKNSRHCWPNGIYRSMTNNRRPNKLFFNCLEIRTLLDEEQSRMERRKAFLHSAVGWSIDETRNTSAGQLPTLQLEVCNGLADCGIEDIVYHKIIVKIEKGSETAVAHAINLCATNPLWNVIVCHKCK